ncbi:MAG: helix-turn-helix domain-containing protein [Methanobacteriota archaeon]
MKASPFFELVYRLRPVSEPRSVPLILCARIPSLSVSTRVSHLDDSGNVWRLLEVRGSRESVVAAERAFMELDLPFVLDRAVLSTAPRLVVLFYKYRPLARAEGFSNTVLAFRLLGRDTIVTDETTEGAVEIRIRARSSTKLDRFFREISDRSRGRYEVTLLRKGPVRDDRPTPGLSPEDERLLRAAFDAGYFDVPRRIETRALAARLGIPPTTLSYRLRTLEAKLLRTYLA